MLHRDAKIWGDDPEKFAPDRFSPENRAKIPPNAYKPFGTGQRACIGRQFALQEATIVLAMLLPRVEFVERGGDQPRRCGPPRRDSFLTRKRACSSDSRLAATVNS
jgi:cytochrome P450